MERMITWNYIVGGLSLFLLIFLIWKEATRMDRSLRAARIAAVVVMVISLACLVLPDFFGRKGRVSSTGREGILLTEGYDPDSLRQFLQVAGPGEVTVFSGERELGYRSPDLVKLHVFGYGLPADQWASLYPLHTGSPRLVFHPSPLRTGIISVNWKQQLLPGERLRLQGTCYTADGKPLKLVLSGMNTALDSITLFGRGVTPGLARGAAPGLAGGAAPGFGRGVSEGVAHGGAADGEQEFELSTIPAQVGRAVYHITVWEDGGELPEKESIPVEVMPGKALTILLLASAPDFENRFLVNWLSQNGHGVATRTTISRGKYDKAYLNMAQVALDHLSPSLLDKFDVTITDAGALRAMGSPELACLRRQVEEKGMGLIIRADSAGNGISGSGFAGSGFLGKSHAGSGFSGVGIQALVRDSLSRILVSRSLYGSGRIVSTTPQNTYVKMLSGHPKEYAAFWSLIIQKAVRDAAPAGRWTFIPALPRVNEPVQVLLQTTEAGLPQGEFGSEAVYLRRHPLLPFLWQGTYWPGEAGWQSGQTQHGDTCWWYAWGEGDWLGLYRRQRWEDTRNYIAELGSTEGLSGGGGGRGRAMPDSAGGAVEAGRGAADRQDGLQREGSGRGFIAKGWWYALLFLSCLFLWIEKKKII